MVEKIHPMPLSSTELPDLAQAGDEQRSRREQDRWTLEVMERDRLSLAGALHNSACQSLSGLQLFAATLHKRLPESPQAVSENIEELSRLLRQVSTELRAVVQCLRPPPMREEGLIVSLLELAADSSREISCEFHCADRRREVDPYAAGQLYQIAHAAVLAALQRRVATRIEIELAADRQGGLCLSIWDNATWAQKSEPGCESGLCNWELLHLRSRAIGGELSVHSPASGGTRVTCRLAMHAGSEA